MSKIMMAEIVAFLPRNLRLTKTVPATVLLGIFLLLPTRLAAQIGGQLPIDTALGNQRPIIVELDAATIQVALDPSPTAKSWLRAAATRTPDDPAAGALEIDWRDGPITVRRSAPPAEGETPTPILVELTVQADQPLVIQGVELEITITTADELRARGAAARGEEPPPRPRPRTLTPSPPKPAEKGYDLELEVRRSRIDLFGVREALILLDDSRLRSEGSRGLLRVEAKNASEAEVLDHQGPLELVGVASDLAVQGTHGAVRFDLRESQVILRDGQGIVEGEAQGEGLLVIDKQIGSTTIKGKSTTLELHGATPQGLLALEGDDLAITIEGWQGTVKIDQRRGSLRATGWSGPSEIAADGTTLDLGQLRGPMALTMKNGASGKVAGLTGLLSARIGRAELELNDVFGLHLEAKDATITGRGVGRIQSFEVERSRIDLDLSNTIGILDVTLRRASETGFQLRTPCVVMVDGATAEDVGRQVSVNGCELQVGYVSPSQLLGARGGQRPTLLRVRVDADAELEVEGITP